MPRGNVWIVLIVIASMLGVWYFGTVHSPQPAQVEAAVVAPGPDEEIPARPTPSRTQIRRTQLQNERANLQAELVKKAQEVEEQKQTLQRLQQQQAALVGTSSLSSQIQSRDLAIQNLMEDLGNYRQAEDDINQSAAMAMQNQDRQAALARAEVDANVQTLEQEIRNTQNELNYWKTYPIGAEVTQQPAQIERLTNQLNQQRDQLKNLRSQRVGISAQVLNNNQSIQSLAEQAKAELRDSANSTQEQVYSLRGDMERLGRTQALSRGQLQNVNQQMSKVQKDLEVSNQEIRKLQESIKNVEGELQIE